MPFSHPFQILDDGPAAGPFDLLLERGAFGGGSHPTTASCLALLSQLAPLTGRSVLDLGSGTGILAIAALKLGAAAALCVDVNPEAVASSRRNGAANGVAERLSHRCGMADDLAGEQFDLVIANIGGEILLDQAPSIAPLARSGAQLLLSGLLRDYASELAAAYGVCGCHLLERHFPGDFCTLLLGRQ